MKRNWLIVLLVGVLLLAGFPTGVTADQPIIVPPDGEELDFEVAPVLELQAIEQVKKYLSLLDKAVKGGLEDEEWEGILSEAAIKSGYGIDARVFKPMKGFSKRSIDHVAIVDARTLSTSPNKTTIVVTARYHFYDQISPDPNRNTTQYEKNYYLIEEQGHLVLDSEETLKLIETERQK